jgi:hypothetical protein
MIRELPGSQRQCRVLGEIDALDDDPVECVAPARHLDPQPKSA